ncbi:MAG: rhodanese-like domain-containing protein [Pseudomonadota bacterium]
MQNSDPSSIWHVMALYTFTPIADIAAAKAQLLAHPSASSMVGTLLIAPEGLNGTLAHQDKEALDAFAQFLQDHYALKTCNLKWSWGNEKPFRRGKFRLKKEIITLREPKANPNKICGDYVTPENWNAVISDPDVLVLDTRNTYETDFGTFKNAVDPRLDTFTDLVSYVRDLPESAKTKPVAMFCTGGIRCEKASAFMLAEGFEKVYHLQGGILRYLETVPQDQSLWQGDCFVFDRRIAVGHGLEPADLPDLKKPQRDGGMW